MKNQQKRQMYYIVTSDEYYYTELGIMGSKEQAAVLTYDQASDIAPKLELQSFSVYVVEADDLILYGFNQFANRIIEILGNSEQHAIYRYAFHLIQQGNVEFLGAVVSTNSFSEQRSGRITRLGLREIFEKVAIPTITTHERTEDERKVKAFYDEISSRSDASLKDSSFKKFINPRESDSNIDIDFIQKQVAKDSE